MLRTWHVTSSLEHFCENVVLMFANTGVYCMQTIVQIVSQLFCFTKFVVKYLFHVENYDQSCKL
jgi:hypothetical protein